MSRRRFSALAIALVVGAVALRALPLGAALPYLAYVDEGHVLHPVERIRGAGTWDPGWYRYPSLLMNAIALTSLVVAPVDPRAVGVSAYYDVVLPAALVVVGRLIVLVTAVATVLLVGWLGVRLVDAYVGAVAALLAAVLPALVSRSAIVIVDTPSAFFATATLCAATALGLRPAPGTALLAGLAAGLATATKYPAGLVLVAVPAALVPAPPWLRARAAAAAIGGFAVGLVLGCPAVVLRPEAVLRDLRGQAAAYAHYGATPGYLAQALGWLEAGPLFLGLAALGTVVLLRAPTARTVTAGWVAFATLLLAVLLRFDFQPFRNLLPLLPFACVAAGAALVRLARIVAPRRTAAAAAVLAMTTAAPMFVWGVQPYLAAQAGKTDTRVVAREWIGAHRHPGERMAVAAELAFAPSELARLGAGVAILPRADLAHAARNASIAWLMVGDPPAGASPEERTAWDDAIRGRRILFAVGRSPTPAGAGFWRGNGQRIVVYGALDS